ncbi:hypothetical protein QEZ54_30775 [Catellatospora sp. KI3]|uniref:hypothetical protein n=1 Tax=Catellatospora sp. KI3 TaxID=3041620 RepID=UPI0024825664|nr:hypothetical protein [Catellatospora sp. KI3]MDI1465361.1 hypothetical protein [Catellatospora sp. KI3]
MKWQSGALGTTLAAALAVSLAACGGQSPAADPVAQPSLSTLSGTPQQLAGGWQVVAATGTVLDRAQSRYVPLELPGGAQLDPTGRRYAVEDDTGVTIVEIAAGAQMLVDDEGPDLQLWLDSGMRWSPDGTRLVGMVSRKEPFAVGFAVIDAKTAKRTEHWFDHGTYDCSFCALTFTRDGREVALSITDRSAGEAHDYTRAVQLFDAETGAPTRTVPARVFPGGPFAWSPDGTRLVGRREITVSGYELVDTATGTAVPFPGAAVWATDDLLLSGTGDAVETLRPDGGVVARAVLAGPLHGQVVLGPPAS